MEYNFDKVIDRTGTLAVKYDLAAKRNKPTDAISLWVADMDFPTAPCVLKALEERVNHGIFGYSKPDSRYYTVLKNWFKTRHNYEIKNEWVVNTPGVVFAIATAIRALTKEGDGVLIQKPVYYPFFQTIAALGRRVVNSPLVMRNGHYEIDFDDFEKKIESENVKLFVFCSPHNPGGRVWSRQELEEVSRICLKHGVIVVSDEIHSDITFGNNRHTVYATLSDEAAENSIVCTSPSKTFNLAGLQFSNIIIKNEKIRKAVEREIDKTGYCEPTLMGIIAATAAYTDGAEWFDAVKDYIHQNIVFITEYLGVNCPKIKVLEPEGTYLVWLDFSAFESLSDRQISDKMLYGAKVWLDDGTLFGREGEKYQRINAATPRPILKEALERIAKEFK